MKLITNILMATIFIGCNAQQEDAEKKVIKQSPTTATASTNCYQYASPSDTIHLKVNRDGNAVTGTLVYNLKEKDKNTGTIQGTMQKDMLLADYTFMSEGVQSTRQVAFKLEGNTLIEGYGESIDQNGKMTFKNTDSLTFNPSFKLSETPCQ